VTQAVGEAAGQGGEPTRRDFIHIAAGAAAVGAAAVVAWPLIDQMNPASDTMALSSIEFDITKVPAGQQVVVKWQGKPLFIRSRTPKEIAEAQNPTEGGRPIDWKSLRDPQRDSDRIKPGHDATLVVIGVCTHLGCVPNFGGGEFGGWFCPCHGSQYDTSGRIRLGPAPKNLPVPDYQYLTPTKIKVG
jgi:ubiquinol-cytochrome c reductase iron-sulfur subunit